MGVNAYIDGDGANGILADNVSLTAMDVSTINAFAGAASLAAAVGGGVGGALSIGVSLAQNEINTAVAAYIANADTGVTAQDGDITLKADEMSTIRATSAAVSLAAGFGGAAGIAISGAGAVADNYIGTSTLAYGRDSLLTASGNVDIDALNNSLIDASIFSASIAIAAGASAGLGASVGVSVARNFIGWDQDPDAASTATYTTGTAFGAITGGEITKGQKVYVESGARAGGLYEYIGDEPLEEPEDSDPDDDVDDRVGWLARVDYSDKTKWKHVNLEADAVLVQAFLEDTSVAAGGDLTIDADADQEIRATVFAGSVALSGGFIGASLSGAGASTENKIKTFVKAYIDGDVEETGTSASISASDVALKADDNSTIDADTGAAAIAAGFGAGGIAVSIGVGLAQNEISNEVDSYIKNADVSTNAQFTSAQTGAAVSTGDRVVLGGD